MLFELFSNKLFDVDAPSDYSINEIINYAKENSFLYLKYQDKYYRISDLYDKPFSPTLSFATRDELLTDKSFWEDCYFY